VGYHDPAATEVSEGGYEEIACLGIKVVGRFVEQEYVRTCNEGGADLPTLALARRQRGPSLELTRVQVQPGTHTHGVTVPVPAKALNIDGQFINALLTQDRRKANRFNGDRASVWWMLPGDE